MKNIGLFLAIFIISAERYAVRVNGSPLVNTGAHHALYFRSQAAGLSPLRCLRSTRARTSLAVGHARDDTIPFFR